MTMYSHKLLDHYRNPRNVGVLPDGPDVGTGLIGAPRCGGVMRMQFRVDAADGLIREARFKTFGSGEAIASGSLITEWLQGLTVEQALGIESADVATELQIPPTKFYCTILAGEALRAAIQDFKQKSIAAQRDEAR